MTMEPSSNTEVKYVFPYTGILVNVPGHENSRSLMDILVAKGIRPTRVRHLSNDSGNSGHALVQFRSGSSGYYDALIFDLKYKQASKGKNDWFSESLPKEGLYGWMGKEDDYISNSPLGYVLRQSSHLFTLCEVYMQDKMKHELLLTGMQRVNREGEHGAQFDRLEKLFLETTQLRQKAESEVLRMACYIASKPDVHEDIMQAFCKTIESIPDALYEKIKCLCEEQITMAMVTQEFPKL